MSWLLDCQMMHLAVIICNIPVAIAVCFNFQPSGYILCKYGTFCSFEIWKMFLAIVHATWQMIVDPNDECIGVKCWHDHQLNPCGIICIHCLHNWWMSDAWLFFKSLLLMKMFAFHAEKDDFCWKLQCPWESEALDAMKTSCGFVPAIREKL